MTTAAHSLAASRGFLCQEDVDLIMEAVRSLPEDRTVFIADLGAGSGTTALAAFCGRVTPDIRIVTVDHDAVAIASTRELLTNAGYVQHWRGIVAKTTEADAEFSGSPFDMLMVDAGHEYEEVKGDLVAWLPLVRDGAPVWCHDYTAEYPGSMRAIEELVAAGFLEPVKTAGWGWLGRKAANRAA